MLPHAKYPQRVETGHTVYDRNGWKAVILGVTPIDELVAAFVKLARSLHIR
jgi:hypothetical protein